MEADPERALDALINILDDETLVPDGDVEIHDSEDERDDIPLVANVPHIVVDPNINPLPKRQRLRSNHCKYCEEACSRENLGAHLDQSERCRRNYFDALKVTNIDAVLLLIFQCLYCNDGPARLSSHLSSSPGCYNSYCARFGVGSLR